MSTLFFIQRFLKQSARILKWQDFFFRHRETSTFMNVEWVINLV